MSFLVKNCRICSAVVEKYFDVLGPRNRQTISVCKCKDCKAFFTFPQAYNYDESDADVIQYYQEREAYILSRHSKIFDFIETTYGIKHAKFLDIGSGLGLSLQCAENRGWEALGIEPCEALASYSAQQLKLNVINGYYSKELASRLLLQGKRKFDYILIDNVLEHIDKPVEFIADALETLADNGVLLVVVPPVDWLRVLIAKTWFARRQSRSAQLNLFYDPEQHINYLYRFSMQKLIKGKLEINLLDNRFHHSMILNNKLAKILGLETGYYFITKSNSFL